MDGQSDKEIPVGPIDYIFFYFNLECPYGTWGEMCTSKCGNCLNGSCDITDGTCYSGCKAGFRDSSHCKEGKI